MLRALDLFCGAGGATKGLQRAGFHVTGVDIVYSPRYCGDAFVLGDVFARMFPTPWLMGFDFIWASPVCKRYSAMSRMTGVSDRHPDQIGWLRNCLRVLSDDWVIENVEGAPLRRDLTLCGRMFGLPLIRHRVFEASFPLEQPAHCPHTGDETPVYGNGTSRYHLDKLGRGVTIEEKRAAMGIDWMNRTELSQAIPPAYSEWIGKQWIKHHDDRMSRKGLASNVPCS